MVRKNKQTIKYYGKEGGYLREHKDFFLTANIDNDIDFIIKALKIKKTDHVLDIACGQGRHANALAQKGYTVDGVDFSSHLLKMAKKRAANNQKFYLMNIERLKLATKYDCAYWFFSDLANIEISRALKAISDNIKSGGRILLDTDNIFRLVSRLQKKPDKNLVFDVNSLFLIEKKSGVRAVYPVVPMWKQWLRDADLKIDRTLGDYHFGEYNIHSPRLILVVKKLA